MKQIREQVKKEDVGVKEGFTHSSQKDGAKGFGGKYGVQSDRKDKAKKTNASVHTCDYPQKNFMHMCMYILVDVCVCVCIPFQSALGWDHQSELAKHGSQIDAAKGFGGKFGVQKDRKDKVGISAPLFLSVLLFSSFLPAFPCIRIFSIPWRIADNAFLLKPKFC